MIDPLSNVGDIKTASDSASVLRAVRTWLDDETQRSAADELTHLSGHLAKLRDCDITLQQRAEVLEKIYVRSVANVESTLPTLAYTSLPAPRNLRHTIRDLQNVLRELAEDLASIILKPHGASILNRPQDAEQALWESMHALSLHLLISNLATSPPGNGVWHLLHSLYVKTLTLGITRERPENTSNSLLDLYLATILLGCAQPSAFTSRELIFVAKYLTRHAGLVTLTEQPASPASAAFWIDPSRDGPATPLARKASPPDTPVIYLDCGRLAALITKQLSDLSAATSPEQLELADFARTPAGHGALRRLADHLGHPKKRQFPRRRQHYRIVLCAGLSNLWKLFHHGTASALETSSWMITNESPDGCSIMHVLGKSADISVGDIVATKTETGEQWQVCIIRWVQSAHREHLELGLQILSSNATPAILTPASGNDTEQPPQQQVLVLPKVPPLRLDEMLITPSGLLGERPTNLILLIEQGNIEVREVRNTRLNEQNGRIEAFSIEPDHALV